MGPQATSTEAQSNNMAGAIAGGVTAGVLVTLVVLIFTLYIFIVKVKLFTGPVFCQFDAISPHHALNQNDIG